MAASAREVQNLITTVVGLQGNPVSQALPAAGDALIFDGTQWSPAPVSVSPPLMGPIIGVTDGSDAAAGMVGEFLQAVFSNPVYATSATDAGITSLTLAAGDWEVWGSAPVVMGEISPPFDGIAAGVYVTWGLRVGPFSAFEGQARVTLGPSLAQPSGQQGLIATLQTGIRRFSLTASTVVQLIGNATLVAGSLSSGRMVYQGGMISARRIR